MRPGHIRVFDGLRVTTEHIDHFQASLHSAIQDLREILGLGVVYGGLGVTAVDDHTIRVEPGLAFDTQRNRIACDEPQTLEVTFDPQQNAAFVCAKYDQIESGESEGRPTLIWDACSLLLRPEPPAAADNLVLLAKVMRAADGTLEVDDLTPDAPTSEGTRAPAVDSPEPTASPPGWTARQGIVRLTSSPVDATGKSIADLVRSAPGGITGSGHDLMVVLASARLPLQTSIGGIDVQVLTSLRVSHGSDHVVTRSSFATAHATCLPEGLTQHGVSPVGCATVTLKEDTMERLRLASADAPPDNGFDPQLRDALERLAFVVRLERTEAAIDVVCTLVWTDITTDVLLGRLDGFQPALWWNIEMGWKFAGQL